jgi:hypothetical protein
MVGAGEWKVLENGRSLRIEIAGEWYAPDNGMRWRLEALETGIAGDWERRRLGAVETVSRARH